MLLASSKRYEKRPSRENERAFSFIYQVARNPVSEIEHP